jgi:hypothetical protein
LAIRRIVVRALALAAATAFMDRTAFAVPPPAEKPSPAAQAQLAAQLPKLAPLAVAWAEHLAASAATGGTRLGAPLEEIARRAGVRAPRKIRIVVRDEIPLPEDPVLKGAALSVGLSQGDAAGMTLGYAVFVRRGYENDLRVLSHEFRHVAQYEASGGIAGFLAVHLADLVAFGYEDSPFEVDARAHEVRSLPAHAKAS